MGIKLSVLQLFVVKSVALCLMGFKQVKTVTLHFPVHVIHFYLNLCGH